MNIPITVLIVDDEPQLGELLSESLRARGFSVDVAVRGKDAIQMAQDRNYPVILLDLLLDDLPGIAVMQEVRRLSPYTEFIVVTGQAPQKSALAAAELGAFTYMIKPCDIDLLITCIIRAAQAASLRALVGVQHDLAILADSTGRVMIVAAGAGTDGRFHANRLVGERLVAAAEECGLGQISPELIASALSGSPDCPSFTALGLKEWTVNLHPLKDGQGRVTHLALFADCVGEIAALGPDGSTFPEALDSSQTA